MCFVLMSPNVSLSGSARHASVQRRKGEQVVSTRVVPTPPRSREKGSDVCGGDELVALLGIYSELTDTMNKHGFRGRDMPSHPVVFHSHPVEMVWDLVRLTWRGPRKKKQNKATCGYFKRGV